MRNLFACLCLALIGTGAFAQGKTATSDGDIIQLRALDTITSEVQDIDLPVGDTIVYERLMISGKECRYPKGNIAGDAFAYLVIRDVRETLPAFEGWMIASSPALSALEHPRYDIWVLHCKMKDAG